LLHIYAEKGFPISVADCRADGFPGTICYYFEVKTLSGWWVNLLIIGMGHAFNLLEIVEFFLPEENWTGKI
jgi:hypothetical protein